MQLDDLYALSNKLSEQGVLLCFNGPISHGVIEQLGQALRKHMQDAGGSGSTVIDVFGVFVEQTQNIQSYVTRARIEREDSARAVLAILKDGPRYVVQSGNWVRDEDLRALRERLDVIRAADSAELKAMYKRQLRATLPESASAGLGLLAMARAASQPLAYRVDAGDEGRSFFTLRVTV